MKSYDILHKTGWVAAVGFYGIERAEQWLKNFNPKMYTDKTLKVEDFRIKETK